MESRRSYDQRVREIEHGAFTPLVFLAAGGMGNAATVMFRKLVSLLATKCSQPYSRTMGWIRCRLSFSLLAQQSPVFEVHVQPLHILLYQSVSLIQTLTSPPARAGCLTTDPVTWVSVTLANRREKGIDGFSA